MHIPAHSSQQLYLDIILTQPPCNLTGPKAILEANLRLLECVGHDKWQWNDPLLCWYNYFWSAGWCSICLRLACNRNFRNPAIQILTETLISKVKSATQGNDWNDPWLRRDQHRDRPPSHPGQVTVLFIISDCSEQMNILIVRGRCSCSWYSVGTGRSKKQ